MTPKERTEKMRNLIKQLSDLFDGTDENQLYKMRFKDLVRSQIILVDNYKMTHETSKTYEMEIPEVQERTKSKNPRRIGGH